MQAGLRALALEERSCEQSEAPTCSSPATRGRSSGVGQMDMGRSRGLCAGREVEAHGLVLAGAQEEGRGLGLLHLKGGRG